MKRLIPLLSVMSLLSAPAIANEKVLRAIECNGISTDGSQKAVAKFKDTQDKTPKGELFYFSTVDLKVSPLIGNGKVTDLSGETKHNDGGLPEDPEDTRDTADNSWGLIYKDGKLTRMIFIQAMSEQTERPARSYRVGVTNSDGSVTHFEGFLGCKVKK